MAGLVVCRCGFEQLHAAFFEKEPHTQSRLVLLIANMGNAGANMGHPALSVGMSKTKGCGEDGLIQQRGLLPVEMAAENGFDDQMIGGRRRTDTHSDVDLPLG
jgi:hypothetical protein